MNKKIFVCFFFALAAYGNPFVTFRYIGYDKSLSISDKIPDKTKSFTCSASNLSIVLEFWKIKLFHNMWNLEKSAFEKNSTEFGENIFALHKNISEIGKLPEAKLVFLSTYAVVLESLTRILQSSNENILTEKLLRVGLTREVLNSVELRHLRTYANMLILAKKISVYRLKNHRLPDRLSQIGDISDCHLDGNGEKIMFVIKGSDFYLFSHIGPAQTNRSISHYIPIFTMNNYNNTLVFSSDMSIRRAKLWKQGELFYSGLHIRLDKKSGTISYAW